MIFITYGQQKSASTFLANLARQSCFAAGSDPDAVKKRLFTGKLESQRKFWHGPLFPLGKLAPQLVKSEHTVIKTHSRYRPAYAKALDRPRIKVLMSYRHLGGAALSVYETGPFLASLKRSLMPWP